MFQLKVIDLHVFKKTLWNHFKENSKKIKYLIRVKGISFWLFLQLKLNLNNLKEGKKTSFFLNSG